jgi:hypothetical protein
MNRVLLAGILALAATVLGGQEAKAGHECNICGSFHMSFTCDGCCLTIKCCCNPYPYCPGPVCGAPGTQAGNSIPTSTSAPYSAYQGWNVNSGYQAAGYYIPQPGYGYGSSYAYGSGGNAGPSYWDGR